MRIGLVIYGSLETLSGGYLYDRMLVRQLESMGHGVEVLSLPWRNYARHLGDNLDRAWSARLATARFDLLLEDELNHPSLLAANRALRRHAAFPVVSIVHHLRSSEAHPAALLPLYRWVERQYLASVDALLYNSQSTQRSVGALAGVHRPGFVAFPAASHLPGPEMGEGEIVRRAQADGPLRILFVGNLIPRKGLHTLLAALAQVDSSRWQLDVVGRADVDARYTAHIHRTIATMRGGSRVRLAGRLSDVGLVEAYRQHHLLAMPSFEGFGIVYLEAMRLGLPVIAATAGAAHEIVTPGWDGSLVPLGDVGELAGTIASLTADRGRLLSMSLAARQRYLRHPTWETSMSAAAAWLKTVNRSQ